MQKKITRTIEEEVTVCDSCNDVITEECKLRCVICHKDICWNCITILEIRSSGLVFGICPECKKSLTIQQVEDRLNEK